MTSQNSESWIVNSVIRALYELPGVWIWRNNCGVAKPPGAQRAIRFGIPGQADISGVLSLDLGSGAPLGVRLEVEVKRPGGRMSQDQKMFRERVESMGGCYLLVTSAEDALAKLKCWIDERRSR